MVVIFIWLKIASRFCLFHSIMFFFSFWKLFIETTHTTDLFHGCFSFDFHQCCIFFSYIDDIGQTYTCNTTRITSNEKRFAILANHDLLISNATTTTKKKWRNKFSQENPFSNTQSMMNEEIIFQVGNIKY